MAASSPHLRLHENVKRGRHLTVTRDTDPGTLLLTEEPVAATLYDVEQHRYCSWTFQPSKNLRRCSRCKAACYSSTEAQRQHWAAGHKQECAALVACRPQRPPGTVRLAALLYWARRRIEQEHADLQVFSAIDSLQHHWEALSDARKQLLAQMAIVTSSFITSTSGTAEDTDVRALARLLACFACNCHTICNDELSAIGIGIYPQAALINHSCKPNAVQVFHKRRIFFRAIQPIKAGDEVTIAYTELGNPRHERRRALLDNYFFDIEQDQPPGLPATIILRPPLKLILWARLPSSYEQADRESLAVNAGSGKCAIGYMAADQQAQHTPVDALDLEHDATDQGSTAAADSQPTMLVQCWGMQQLPGTVLETAATSLANLAWQHKLAHVQGRLQPRLALRTLQQALHAADSLAASSLGQLALGPCHIWRRRFLELALKTAIDSGSDWPMAYSLNKSLLLTYETVLPEVWPVKGLQYASAARIAALLELPAEAAAFANQAVQNLKYTHAESTILQDLLMLIHESSANAL